MCKKVINPKRILRAKPRVIKSSAVGRARAGENKRTHSLPRYAHIKHKEKNKNDTLQFRRERIRRGLQHFLF